MYTTVDFVQSLGGSGEIEFIAKMIEVADEYINSETQDNFSQLEEDEAKIFDGRDLPHVLVRPRLVFMTKLEYLSDYETNTWTEYDLSTGIYSFGKGWVLVDSSWSQPYRSWIKKTSKPRVVFPKGFQNIRVTGNWGWASVPKQIDLVSATLARELSSKFVTELSSERLGDYSYNNLSKQVQKTVEGLSIENILLDFKLHKIVGVLV